MVVQSVGSCLGSYTKPSGRVTSTLNSPELLLTTKASCKHPVFSPKMAVGAVTPGAPPPIPRRWVRVGPSAPPRLQPDFFSRRDTPLRRAPCPGSQALSRHLSRLPGRPPLPARGRRVVPGPASLSQIKFSRGEI